ncbi:MAG: hypothetical protein D6731_08120 [Planctomycetota bacterium]|nr:MAG: hypothetical protein D6731_08120 [Planctomycetota bacterium]
MIAADAVPGSPELRDGDLRERIAALASPEAYPHPVGEVEVVQTHISVVFLTERFAYKLKKPVDLGFLDYSTSARRRRFCSAEVELNRRLAADVYLRVAPLARGRDGRLRVDGEGRPVDWLVVMRRLPDDRHAKALLERDELTADRIDRLAERLARFHREATRGPRIARFGSFEAVAGNCRENFAQLEPFVGRTVHPEVFARLREATEAELARRRPLIEARAAHGVPCDGHGDLRLEHVYFLADRPPPRDVVVVDCIEFNERFRYGDPMADLAFLLMELRKEGRADLAARCAERYVAATGDAEGRALLPLYTAYRATVRGKVHGFAWAEPELPAPERTRALERARGDLLFADALLRPRGERPCVVLVGGLPGTGKSTLAQALAERANLRWIRSDAVRKQLAGLTPRSSASAPPDEGIYAPAWTERTYRECLERVEDALFAGRRALVDASFVSARWRRAFFEAARRWEVPFVFLRCELEPEIAHERLARRAPCAEAVSDADAETYDHLARRWVESPPEVERRERAVSTRGTPREALDRAWAVLQEFALV